MPFLGGKTIWLGRRLSNPVSEDPDPDPDPGEPVEGDGDVEVPAGWVVEDFEGVPLGEAATDENTKFKTGAGVVEVGTAVAGFSGKGIYGGNVSSATTLNWGMDTGLEYIPNVFREGWTFEDWYNTSELYQTYFPTYQDILDALDGAGMTPQQFIDVTVPGATIGEELIQRLPIWEVQRDQVKFQCNPRATDSAFDDFSTDLISVGIGRHVPSTADSGGYALYPLVLELNSNTEGQLVVSCSAPGTGADANDKRVLGTREEVESNWYDVSLEFDEANQTIAVAFGSETWSITPGIEFNLPYYIPLDFSKVILDNLEMHHIAQTFPNETIYAG